MSPEELLQVIEKAAQEQSTELDLSGQNLTALPPEIGKLVHLKKLILGKYKYDKQGYITGIGNNLSALPPEIGQLVHLEELYLVSNRLSSLPSEFGQLTNLQSLNLSNNKLSSLSSEFRQLTNLQSLDLSNNNLGSLPSEFGQLANLQSLNLNVNKLSSLPSEFGQLTNLQSLDLTSNQLSSLPSEFGQLTNLQSLQIYNNQLSSLLSEILQLTNLQSLGLRANRLSSLPSEIAQLSNLQSLDLSHNNLSSLPSEFVQLSNLQSLDLSRNNLSSLPREFGQLTKLQFLNLSHNHLSSLSSKFGQLTKLQFLNLSHNNLSSLPSEFGQLTNLQSLKLSHNNLSSLPLTIRNLQNLKKLDIRSNPVPIPPEILGSKNLREAPSNVSEILDFYFRVQDPNETEPLYEAKLLIIGEGGAGKTSLAKKIQDENYQLQEEERSTQGIDVIQWKFPLFNGKEFRVNIWDFGGQEIYHQTHQFFLTKRSLYALVADDRKENTDFYWWLKIVELLSDNSPVVIVKNEKQDRACEVNERQLRGEFTKLEKIVATNLATNRGLTQVKKIISQYICGLEHVDIPLPKIWVRIRSALENDSRNYISLEQYYELCSRCGVYKLSDRLDMLRLSGYLHDLGVCLHFQDDSTLKHWVILKPEWGTSAVYKVLDNKSVQQNLGRFTHNDLAAIWNDSKYADMRDELLQLMIRFKLCYPLRENLDDHYPKNYIAPQLLNPNQPNYTWNNESNLILRYKYEFMPKGILTRFIVETHPWIEELSLVWRSGVVLNKDNSRAEVIENYHLKEIKVRVAGNRKKELLAVVTHELEKIHSSFKHLNYDIFVPCNCEICKKSQTPHTYPLKILHRFIDARQSQIQCQNSFGMVNVRELVDDVNLPPEHENQESDSHLTGLQSELEQEKDRSVQITIHNVYSPSSSQSQSQTMNEYTDSSRNLNISGGTVNASGAGAFGLGDISGTIANTSMSGGTMYGGIQTSQGNHNTQAQENPVTNNRTANMGDGNYNESIEGNYVQGDYFAAAANEIQSLLQQLEKSNNTNTTAGKMAIALQAIEHIKSNPTLAARILSALKAGGTEALAQLLNHPATSFFIGALEDWYNTHQDK